MAIITINIEDILYDAGLDDLPEPPEPEYDIIMDIDVTPGSPAVLFAAPEDCRPAEPAEAEPEHDEYEVAKMALKEYERQIGFEVHGEHRKSFIFHAVAHARMEIEYACAKAIAALGDEDDCQERDDD